MQSLWALPRDWQARRRERGDKVEVIFYLDCFSELFLRLPVHILQQPSGNDKRDQSGEKICHRLS